MNDIKDESRSEQSSQKVDKDPNVVKNESESKASLVEMIQTKQEARDKFDIYKMDSEVKQTGNKSKPIHVVDKNNAEEFNKFMLACIWEKRIPKNEILLMDLAQNISILRQAVDDEQIELNQALKILVGLQKVYLRMIGYLHDDSKYILGELQSPFKVQTKDEEVQVKGEFAEAGSKRQPKQNRRQVGANPISTMKLDLNNSKWWKSGFDNSYFQEQLNKFLQDKEAAKAAGVVDATHLNETNMMMPIGVRGAADKNSGVKDISMLSDMIQGQDISNKDIRLQEHSIEFYQQIGEEQLRGAFDDGFEGPSPIQDFMDFQDGGQSPKFGENNLISMMKNIDQVDKKVFGGEKVIDQLYQDLIEENGESPADPVTDIQANSLPKDVKKRQNYEKFMIGEDAQLNAKVKKVRNKVRVLMQEEEILPFQHEGLDFHIRGEQKNFAVDPLVAVLQLNTVNPQDTFDKSKLSVPLMKSTRIQEFLGIGAKNESTVFYTPAQEFEESPMCDLPNYGEDIHNEHIFQDAFQDNQVNDISPSNIKMNSPEQSEEAKKQDEGNKQEHTLNQLKEKFGGQKNIKIGEAAEQMGGKSRKGVTSLFMDLLIAQKEGTGVKIAQNQEQMMKHKFSETKMFQNEITLEVI